MTHDESSDMSKSVQPQHNTTPTRHRWALLLLIGAFLIAGLTYDVTVPIFEKPDESYHFFFVVRLARGEGLPDQRTVSDDDLWQQEGSQPPLYHLLAGALLGPLSLDNAETYAQTNPHHTMGMPTLPGNKNVYVHAPTGPFASTTHWAVHLARWLSLLMGAVTVWATWQLARELLPAQPIVAWAAALFVAFTPQFLFISSAVSNDATVSAAVTVALWLLVRALRRGLTAPETLVFALACGAAALTKLNGLLFVAVAVGMLVPAALRDRTSSRPKREWEVPPLAVAAGLIAAVVLVAGWWYWRNWQLYGDPTGLVAMLDVIGRREDPLTWSYLKWELSGLGISYWALFGWFNVLADDWFYPLMEVVVLGGAVGLAWRLLRHVRARHAVPLQLHWIPVIVWPVLVFAGLIRWTMLTPGVQGRLLFPAVAPIAILIVLGWLALVPRRWQRAVVLGAGVAWMLWAFLLPWRVIVPAYTPPPHGPDVALPADATQLGYRYGPVRLLGYTLEPVRVGRSEPFFLTLYWQSDEALARNYSVGVKVFGRNGQLIAREDSYPGLGTYPTEFWQPGETVIDRYKIWISGQADLPVYGDVWVDLYRRETLSALPVTTSAGEPVSVPRIGRLKVAPLPAPDPSPPRVRFDDGIGLDTSTVSPQTLGAGDTVTTTLTWQPYAAPSADYSVFVHLVPAGERTAPLSQSDGRPRDGAYPTHVWTAGERITDTHRLQVPSDLPAGDYDLLIGLYDPETLQRLGVADGNDHLRVARLTFDGDVWHVEALSLAGVARREGA